MSLDHVTSELGKLEIAYDDLCLDRKVRVTGQKQIEYFLRKANVSGQIILGKSVNQVINFADF